MNVKITSDVGVVMGGVPGIDAHALIFLGFRGWNVSVPHTLEGTFLIDFPVNQSSGFIL